MSLYAVNEDDLIHAGDAEPGKIYWCMDCFGPVKRRRGKSWLPHFYHVKTSPQCRLYSKTEDHMLAQVQIQKMFPPNVLQLERPFIDINRVADACWESEKIVFEIQCSPMSDKEAEMRIRDYQSIGYDVIWLLDDKRYNKRVARPAEEFLRRHSAYYTSIKRSLTSDYYDQFEVFSEGKRIKKGKRLPIDLQKIRRTPKTQFSEELFPKQIIHLNCAKYFVGDRLHRALQNSPSMQYWRMLEKQQAAQKPNPFRVWLNRYILSPYANLLKAISREN